MTYLAHILRSIGGKWRSGYKILEMTGQNINFHTNFHLFLPNKTLSLNQLFVQAEETLGKLVDSSKTLADFVKREYEDTRRD